MKSLALAPFLCLPLAAQTAQIDWQRSLEDALWVSRQTGRPLLICVNMDGEVFCERYANQTYHDPGFVALTRGYVPLIVSPNRHTERDYDHAGRRVPCPRFGEVTCSEHIYIEPLLFERYFNGERSAPRHIGVSVEGEILFDRYLDRSMQTAIDMVRENCVTGVDLAPVPTTAAGLLQRRDTDARVALESVYRVADTGARRVLLEAAVHSNAQPVGLLRMGLRESDQALFAAAAEALAETATPSELIDVEDALARSEGATRARLERALVRLAEQDDAARRRHAFLAAVAAGEAWAATEPWRSAAEMAPAAPAVIDATELDRQLGRLDSTLDKLPDDADIRLERGRLWLLFARDRIAQGKDPTFVLHDARSDGEKAAHGGRRADGLAVQASASWLLGETERAAEFGAAAVAAMADAGAEYDAAHPLAAQTLEAAGKGSLAATYAAVQADAEAVPAETMQVAAGALAALIRHPYGTEQHLLDFTGLLEFAGARRRARETLREGLARYPASPAVHEAFRNRVLVDLGADGLVQEYSDLVGAARDAATAAWFGGYAALVAAEVDVRDEREEAARAEYGRSIAWFGQSAEANPDYADSANHFSVLALAGRAWLDSAAGEHARAADDLLRAAELRPASLHESDGIGRKPIDLVQRLVQQLRSAGDEALATRLDAVAQG